MVSCTLPARELGDLLVARRDRSLDDRTHDQTISGFDALPNGVEKRGDGDTSAAWSCPRGAQARDSPLMTSLASGAGRGARRGHRQGGSGLRVGPGYLERRRAQRRRAWRAWRRSDGPGRACERSGTCGKASVLVAYRRMVKARTAARARPTRRPRRRHLRPRSRRGAAGHRAGKRGAPSLRGRPSALLGTPLPRTRRAPLASLPRRRLHDPTTRFVALEPTVLRARDLSY